MREYSMNSLSFMCITVHFLSLVLVLNEGRMVIYTCQNRFSLTSSKRTCFLHYSFGTGPYLFFLFCPGKNASRITAAMKITAIVRVAVSCDPRYCAPS